MIEISLNKQSSWMSNDKLESWSNFIILENTSLSKENEFILSELRIDMMKINFSIMTELFVRILLVSKALSLPSNEFFSSISDLMCLSNKEVILYAFTSNS